MGVVMYWCEQKQEILYLVFRKMMSIEEAKKIWPDPKEDKSDRCSTLHLEQV